MKNVDRIQKSAKSQKQPAKRGGARPGSGPKPSEKAARVMVGVRLDPANRAWLEAEAAAGGCSMSDVVNRIIEGQR